MSRRGHNVVVTRIDVPCERDEEINTQISGFSSVARARSCHITNVITSNE